MKTIKFRMTKALLVFCFGFMIWLQWSGLISMHRGTLVMAKFFEDEGSALFVVPSTLAIVQ